MSKIYIDSTGSVVQGINSPFLDSIKEKLGDVSIHRASCIEFNNVKKKWECLILETAEEREFDTRKEAIDWEISVIQELLKNNEQGN